MPRSARLDAPGVLHHIRICGIERPPTFRCDRDLEELPERLSTLLPDTHTACYNWAFLPNHTHFLLCSGPAGISLLLGGSGTGVEQHIPCKEAGDESAGSGIRCRERGRTGKRARPFSRKIDLFIYGRPVPSVPKLPYGPDAKLPPGDYQLIPRPDSGEVLKKAVPLYTTLGETPGVVIDPNGKVRTLIGPHCGVRSKGCPLFQPTTEGREQSKSFNWVIQYYQQFGGTTINVREADFCE